MAGGGNVIHGFRHSFRDRLRAVSAPIDMIDQPGVVGAPKALGNAMETVVLDLADFKFLDENLKIVYFLNKQGCFIDSSRMTQAKNE